MEIPLQLFEGQKLLLRLQGKILLLSPWMASFTVDDFEN